MTDRTLRDRLDEVRATTTRLRRLLDATDRLTAVAFDDDALTDAEATELAGYAQTASGIAVGLVAQAYALELYRATEVPA